MANTDRIDAVDENTQDERIDNQEADLRASFFENERKKTTQAFINLTAGKTPMNALMRTINSANADKKLGGDKINPATKQRQTTLRDFVNYIMAMRFVTGQNSNSMISAEDIVEKNLQLAPYAIPVYDEQGNVFYDLSMIINYNSRGELNYEQGKLVSADIEQRIKNTPKEDIEKICEDLAKVTGIELRLSDKANIFMPSKISSLKHAGKMIGKGGRFNTMSGVLYIKADNLSPNEILTRYISQCATMSISTNIKNFEKQLNKDRDFLTLDPTNKNALLTKFNDAFKSNKMDLQYQIHSICSDLIASEMTKMLPSLKAQEKYTMSQAYLLSAAQRINGLGDFTNDPYLMKFIANTVTDAVSRFDSNYKFTANDIRKVNESMNFKKKTDTNLMQAAIFGEYDLPFAGVSKYTLEPYKEMEKQKESDKSNENASNPTLPTNEKEDEKPKENTQPKSSMGAISSEVDIQRERDRLNRMMGGARREKKEKEDEAPIGFRKGRDGVIIPNEYYDPEADPDAPLIYQVAETVEEAEHSADGFVPQKDTEPQRKEPEPREPYQEPEQIFDPRDLFNNVPRGTMEGREYKGQVGIHDGQGNIIPTQSPKDKREEKQKETNQEELNLEILNDAMQAYFDAVAKEEEKGNEEAFQKYVTPAIEKYVNDLNSIQEEGNREYQEQVLSEAMKAYIDAVDREKIIGDEESFEKYVAPAIQLYMNDVERTVEQGNKEYHEKVVSDALKSHFNAVKAEEEKGNEEAFKKYVTPSIESYLKLLDDEISKGNEQDLDFDSGLTNEERTENQRAQKTLDDFMKTNSTGKVKDDSQVVKKPNDIEKMGKFIASKGTFGAKSDKLIEGNISKYMEKCASKALAEKSLQDKTNMEKITDTKSFMFHRAQKIAASQASMESLFNNCESTDKKTQQNAFKVIRSLLESKSHTERVESQTVMDLDALVKNETARIINTYKRMKESKDLSDDEKQLLERWGKAKTSASFVNYYANTILAKSEIAKEEYKKSQEAGVQPLLSLETAESGKSVKFANALKNKTKQVARVASGRITIVENVKAKDEKGFFELPDGRYVQRYESGDKNGTKCFRILESVTKGDNDAKIVENKVYSEHNLLYERGDMVDNVMLGRDNIDKALSNGGYLGYVSIRDGKQIINVDPKKMNDFQKEYGNNANK